MAFTKLQQTVPFTLQIGFTKFPEIHRRNILAPVKIIDPKTKVVALSRGSLRQIHAAAFLSTEADSIKLVRRGTKNLNLPKATLSARKDAKLKLPDELSQNVVKLTCDSTAKGGKCDVYVVGTVHVLEESAMQVKAIINHLKPEVVFLELCEARASMLTRTPQSPKVDINSLLAFMASILQVLCGGKTIMNEGENETLLGVILSFFYANVGEVLNIDPGSEFRVVYEEANKYGAKVILGDRPIHITEKRGLAQMSPSDQSMYALCLVLFLGFLKLELVDLKEMAMEMFNDQGDLKKMVEEMSNDQGDLKKVVEEISNDALFPGLDKVIVDERDQYMSSRLLEAASKHSSVVAVVGKAHLTGIKKYWKKPIVIEDLLELPQQYRSD